VLYFFISCAAEARTIDKIVVFGDSLSDNGNFFEMTDKSIPKEPPYFKGRFSNGPVWIELLAKNLKLDITSKLQFTDYAFALAWASDATENGSGGLVSLSWEINNYLEQDPTHGEAAKNNLFVLWIGSNDYLTGRPNEDAEVVTDNAIKFIQQGVERLIKDGARHFLIINLPDLGETPTAKEGGNAFIKRLSFLSTMHNQKLSRMIAQLSLQHPEIEFTPYDLIPIFNDIIQNPEKYNYKNVSLPCYMGGYGTTGTDNNADTLSIKGHNIDLRRYPSVREAYRISLAENDESDFCSNPNEYLFWDHVHPTAATHQLIAKFVMELFVTQYAKS